MGALTLALWTGVLVLSAGLYVSGQCNKAPIPCPINICRCGESANECSPDPNYTCDACAPGWNGRTCQKRNLVYGSRGANSNVGSRTTDGKYYRLRAFDGNFTTEYRSETENYPFLWVKLPNDTYWSVYFISIYNQVMDTGELTGFQIYVTNTISGNQSPDTLCYTDGEPKGQPEYHINCSHALIGRYVRIVVPRYTRIIIREMQINNCANYWFGQDSDRICNCRNSTEVCDGISGQCTSGCPDGYLGNDCYSVCQSGSFGQECLDVCRCKNQSSCDNVNGTCDDSGCAAGYKGNNCQQICESGSFGQECLDVCHCKNQSSCDNVNGTCDESGCAAGYKGGNCQQNCPSATFGEKCQELCRCKDQSSCNKIDGTCDTNGCDTGYRGDNCQQVCENGTFGEKCQHECGRCLDNVTCDHMTGTCLGACQIGYEGSRCKIRKSQSPMPDGSEAETARTIGVAVGSVSVLIIAGVVLAFVIFHKRRKQPKNVTKSDIGLREDYIDFKHPAPHTVDDVEEEDEVPNLQSIYANTGDVPTSQTTVQARDLLDYVTQKTDTDLEMEFGKLPTGILEKTEAANKPHNLAKCRYIGIVPYDITRVVLETVNNDPKTDFINASYIHGYSSHKAFIASQGATKVNIDDFWRMIWQAEVGKIVMLTHLFEKGKQKTLQYWPDEGVTKYGDISVETLAVQNFMDHCVRVFKVQKGRTVRTVSHFHYLDWRDHDVPRDTPGLIELRDKVIQTPSKLSGPTVVHCSAGVGRTGTYIAFDFLIRKLEAEPEVDIFQTVVALRHQRPHMVQTKAQYVFLHAVLRDAYLSRVATFPDDPVARLNVHVESPEFTNRVNVEFETLIKLRTPFDKTLYSAALHEDNIGKNRDLKCIPADADRVWLMTGSQNYINAMPPAGGNHARIISTQLPIGNRKVDLWRLIYEQRCSSLILLNNPTESDEVYWPVDENTLTIGPFHISLVEEKTGNTMTVRTLSVIYENMKNTSALSVNLYCFTGWKEGEAVPSTAADMIAFKCEILTHRQAEVVGPVIVQCRNGSDRACLFSICDFLSEQVKSKQSINVLLTVKRFQAYFINGMMSQAQYRYCYEVVDAYRKTLNVYANFS